jgi:hypothetical protein
VGQIERIRQVAHRWVTVGDQGSVTRRNTWQRRQAEAARDKAQD